MLFLHRGFESARSMCHRPKYIEAGTAEVDAESYSPRLWEDCLGLGWTQVRYGTLMKKHETVGWWCNGSMRARKARGPGFDSLASPDLFLCLLCLQCQCKEIGQNLMMPMKIDYSYTTIDRNQSHLLLGIH